MILRHANTNLEYTKSVRDTLHVVRKSHIEYAYPPLGSTRTQSFRVSAETLGLISFQNQPIRHEVRHA